MVYRADVLQVMIASPGDVTEERNAAREEIISWNYIDSYEKKLVILPVGWETHSSPELGDRPQAIINKQVLDDCDILIGIFWTRLGTPTDLAASGTVEEIQRHHAAGKPAMIYFSAKPVAPESIDAEQFEMVQKFRKWCRENGLYDTFDDLQDFKNKFSTHLRLLIGRNEYIKSILIAHGVIESGEDYDQQKQVISDDASELLVAAAEKDGTIMKLRYLGGGRVTAGGGRIHR